MRRLVYPAHPRADQPVLSAPRALRPLVLGVRDAAGARLLPAPARHCLWAAPRFPDS